MDRLPSLYPSWKMLTAAIFDMDGLLTESESRWRIAEREACARLGLPLTDADFDATMGVRMRQVAEIWYAGHPWDGPTPDEVATQVIDRVIELCADATPLPGVVRALGICQAAGLRLALCSSSDERMITAVLESIGLSDRFEIVHSAERDEHGKPHPQPYLVTADLLGVSPSECLVFEDSVAGCLAAKSAGMKLIAVPDAAERGSARFGFADAVLETLEQFDVELVDALNSGVTVPTISRPRFHLAFPVDDLVSARWFYGDVLGCREGRSSDRWVDFDFHGHQIVAHLVDGATELAGLDGNDVDGHVSPVRHFGLLLPTPVWNDVIGRLQNAEVTFVMEPIERFVGQSGEQRTCFVLDPAGNALEFKSFADDRATFAVDQESS